MNIGTEGGAGRHGRNLFRVWEGLKKVGYYWVRFGVLVLSTLEWTFRLILTAMFRGVDVDEISHLAFITLFSSACVKFLVPTCFYTMSPDYVWSSNDFLLGLLVASTSYKCFWIWSWDFSGALEDFLCKGPGNAEVCAGDPLKIIAVWD